MMRPDAKVEKVYPYPKPVDFRKSIDGLAAQDGVERLGCWAHARRKFFEAQKVQPKGKTGRTDIALNLINKLYGIERDLKEGSDEDRKLARQARSQPVLAQLKTG